MIKEKTLSLPLVLEKTKKHDYNQNTKGVGFDTEC